MLRELIEKGSDEDFRKSGHKFESDTRKMISEGKKAYENTAFDESCWRNRKGKTFSDIYPKMQSQYFGHNSTPRDNQIGAATAIVMKNQKEFMEQAYGEFGEGVVLNSLGSLAPRVVDVVRIFFPQLIANLVAEIQAMDGPNGSVITIKPRYTSTGGGVQAGQEVFTNATDGSYASDEVTHAVGTGDGTDVTHAATLAMKPVRPGTVKVLVDGKVVGTDNGNGGFSGGVTGTINYQSGAFATTAYTTTPAANEAIVVEYRWDLELSPDSVRELEIGINLVPVQAKPHPLRFRYSIEAQLAAQSAYNIDVQDTVSDLAAQFMKKERDYRLVSKIVAAATDVDNLNFDAEQPANSNITKRMHYQDFSIKINQAKSEIFKRNNRGSVSFILCGINAENIISQQQNFVREDVLQPVGAHRTGTLDGNVDVILDANINANTYVFGFRGMQTGDAAVILAEYIPIYITPVFQNPNLENSQGLLSMYDTLMNNVDYFVKGTVSNFTA